MNNTDIAPDLGLIRVLVLDDHMMFAESLSRLLRDETDIDVVATAATLREAVDAAAREQPDVVIVDFLLPDCDIGRAAAELRAVAPDVKLLVVTAYNDRAALVAALDAGCDGFVTKDRAARDVVHAMRAIRAGRREVSIEVLAQAWSTPPGTLLPPGAAPVPIERLTPRENEVLALLAGGRSSSDIAERLGVSVNTVRNHVQRVFTKLGAHSRIEAVAIAVERGLLDDPGRRG
jgi:DNA-binding NarL/FixJ family response regulator